MRGFARPFCLLILIVCTAGAHAAAPILGSTAESKRAREAVPAQGKAIIYIYRRHDDASGVSPVIWLNTFEVGRLVPGSFTAWQLSPGQLEIRVDGVEPTTLSLTSEPGKVYLIRVSVTRLAAGTGARLTRLPPESGRADLAATQLIKNPRDVTDTVVAVPAPAPVPARPAAPAAPPKSKPEPKVADAPDEPIRPGGFSLILKAGALTLSEDIQEIGGLDRSFDDKASGVYALEAHYQLRNGVALGGEIIGYSTQVNTVGFSDDNDVDVFIFFLNAKKYFRSDTSLQPFIGAGLGGATVDVSGPTIDGSTSGTAFQVMGGVEYRSKGIGVYAEAKYIKADTESGNDEKIDVSGTGLFVGVSFHF